MSSMKPLAISLAALCFAPLACLAQGSQGTLYEVVTAVVKPGMTAKFEQGLKQVNAYAQSHGDTTGTASFEVMFGPNEGNIIILIPFKWENLDHPPDYEAGLGQAINKDVEPYLSSAHTSLARAMPNLGNPPAANAAPEKCYEVIQVEVKPGSMDDFMAAVAQITEAEHKANSQPNPVIVYEEEAGGDAYEVTVAIGHPDFADFGRPGKSNFEALSAAFGVPAARSTMSALYGSIASEQNFIVRYRPDLSFTPGGAQ
jgi:hypothetical protein